MPPPTADNELPSHVHLHLAIQDAACIPCKGFFGENAAVASKDMIFIAASPGANAVYDYSAGRKNEEGTPNCFGKKKSKRLSSGFAVAQDTDLQSAS